MNIRSQLLEADKNQSTFEIDYFASWWRDHLTDEEWALYVKCTNAAYTPGVMANAITNDNELERLYAKYQLEKKE